MSKHFTFEDSIVVIRRVASRPHVVACQDFRQDRSTYRLIDCNCFGVSVGGAQEVVAETRSNLLALKSDKNKCDIYSRASRFKCMPIVGLCSIP